MPKLQEVAIVCLVVIFSGDVSGRAKTQDPLVANFYALPENERNDFLVYFLAVGLSEGKTYGETSDHISSTILDELALPHEMVHKFKVMEIPPKSVKELLVWSSNQFRLDKDELLQLALTRNISTPYGYADIGDINDLCCPW